MNSNISNTSQGMVRKSTWRNILKLFRSRQTPPLAIERGEDTLKEAKYPTPSDPVAISREADTGPEEESVLYHSIGYPFGTYRPL